MLQELIKLISERQLQVYGIRVIQGGRLIGSYDFAPYERYPIYSATKSFTSTAVGLAMEESNLSLEDNILKYFEEDLPKDCSTAIKDNLEKITLKRLLTMSVNGYPFRPEGEDWLTYSLTLPLTEVDTEVFAYSNIPAYLTGVIVEKVVGLKLSDYLEKRVLTPLGINNAEFLSCPKGHTYGASGMRLTVDELARLGLLYLQQGQWKGKRILSAHWVQEATAKQINCKEGGYGYFFWRCQENGYQISGKWGQRCFIFPDKELVIAYLGNLQDNMDRRYLSQCIYETIVSRW